MIRLIQQMRIANPTGHIQRHTIVLRHCHDVGNILQQFLRFGRLLAHTLWEDDSEEMGFYGTESSTDSGGVGALSARGVHVIS